MIVTVYDPHKTDSCTLSDRIYHVKYYMSVYGISVVRKIELSALPELAEHFAGHSYGYMSAEYKLDTDTSTVGKYNIRIEA